MQICCKSCDSKDCDGCNIMILTGMLQKGQLNGYMTDNHTIDPKRFIQERKTPTITEATLLSVEEAERLPDHLRKYDCWWWLRSPGNLQDYAANVGSGGSVYYYGLNVDHDSGAVRPALKISNLESADLRIGDRFKFGGVEFEIVSDNLAFCVSDIGYCAFRENWEADDANDYKASDVKKFVDDWFKNASANKGTSRKENLCVISAIFSSYWDGDIVISSPCKVNIATGQITEIKKFTGEVNVDSLDRECVEIDGKEHEVFHADERTPGQFCFWYDE